MRLFEPSQTVRLTRASVLKGDRLRPVHAQWGMSVRFITFVISVFFWVISHECEVTSTPPVEPQVRVVTIAREPGQLAIASSLQQQGGQLPVSTEAAIFDRAIPGISSGAHQAPQTEPETPAQREAALVPHMPRLCCARQRMTVTNLQVVSTEKTQAPPTGPCALPEETLSGVAAVAPSHNVALTPAGGAAVAGGRSPAGGRCRWRQLGAAVLRVRPLPRPAGGARSGRSGRRRRGRPGGGAALCMSMLHGLR